MTLCIAAHCMEPDWTGSPRIVAAFDWKIEEDSVGSSEGHAKLRHLTEEWVALLAGPSISETEDLALRYQAFLVNNHEQLTRGNLRDQLRRPLNAYRESLADRHTHGLLAVPYSDFLDHGENWFPEELRRQVALEIAQQKIDAEIVLIGVVEKEYLVIADCVYGEVRLCHHFTAIGSGHSVAKASLYHRGQESTCPLSETIYSIFEAKKLGENVPGVGKVTTILVVRRNEDGTLAWDVLQSEDIEFEESLYHKFGPKELDVVALPPTVAASESLRRRPLNQEGPRPPLSTTARKRRQRPLRGKP